MGGSTGTDERAEEGLQASGDGFKVSLLLLVRDEQETIRATVRRADAVLAAVAADHEILVVDDGSTDATADTVRAEAAANPRVRLLFHPRRRGRGAALRTGLETAALDLVVIAPAAWHPDAGELATLLPFTHRHAVVCGRHDSPRGLLARGHDTLAEVLLGVGVRDAGGAVKVVRRDSLGALRPESKNTFADTEILARAARHELSVVEVAINQPGTGRAAPPRRTWREGARGLAALVRFWWGHILFPAPEADLSAARGPLWIPLLLLALIASVLLFPNLSYPLLEPDEGRYAEIGREMLASGDWVVPTLNHEPYYDKPPLLYWLVAASLHLFGTHAWAARMVPTGAAFLTLLATFFFARRHFGARAGFLSGLALALMPAFVQCGRTLIIDSVLALFVALSLFTAYEAIRRRRLHWGWWAISAVCCGLAVLTKGPVALILLGPPVVACAWLRRNGARPGLLPWAAYLGVVVAMAAPWFAVFIVRDPSFAYQFFVQHHLMRYLGEDFHAGPIWFYLPVLGVGCLPWSFLFPSWVRFLFARCPAAGALRPHALGFCLLSAGWCLLFFSLSRGKLPPYILPSLPAFAVLVGCYLEPLLCGSALTGLLERARRHVPRVAVAVLAIVWLAAAAWSWARGLGGAATAPRLLAEAVVCVAFLAGAIFCGRRLAPRTAWVLCAVFSFGLVLEIANGLVPAWSMRCSPVPKEADLARWRIDGETAVICWGDEWGSVAFHLEREGLYLSTTHCAPDEVPRFLEKHRRNLVISKDELDLAQLRRVVPPGMEVQHLGSGSRSRAFLVSAFAPQARATR